METVELQEGSRFPFQRAGSSFFNVKENQFLLLGGGNRSEEFEDLWELNIIKENNKQLAKWQKIELKQNAYTKRTGQSAQIADNNLFIFGGQNFNINKHYDEFLVYDINKKDSIQKVQSNVFGPKNLINEPGERNSSAMTYDHTSKTIYLSGGADPQEPLSELYSYSIEKNEWKQLKQEGVKLDPVEMHTLDFYMSEKDITKIKSEKNKKKKQKQKNKKLIDLEFGNNLTTTSQNQETQKQENVNNEDNPENIAKSIKKVNLEFDPNTVTNQDEELDQEAQKQIEKFEEQEIILQKNKNEQEQEKNQEDEEEEEEKVEDKQEQNDNQQNKTKKYLIQVGGRYKEKVLQDINAYDIEQNTWYKLAELPFPICAHASVVIQEKNELWIFGGTDGGQFLDTLFIYNFMNAKMYVCDLYENLKPDSKKNKVFGPKLAPSMALDVESKSVLIFGGSSFEGESSMLYSIDYTKINSQNKVKKI